MIQPLAGSNVQWVVSVSYPRADPSSRNLNLRAKGRAEQLLAEVSR